MATGLGFCPSCGTARSAAEQKFCASCGAVLSVVAPPPAAPAAPAAPQVEVTQPPPPAAPAAPAAPEVEAALPLPPAWALPPAPVPPEAPEVEAAPPLPPAWALPPAPAAPVVTPAYQVAAPATATPAKTRISPALVLVGLILIAAVAGGAYLFTNNGSKSPSSGGPNPTALATRAGSNGPAAQPGTSSQPGASSQAGNGSDLSGAASAFSNISSYKFSMTLAGGDFGSMLSALNPGASSGNAPFTMSGTVTLTPDKAADINMAGFHMIEIGGFDYLDMGGTGSFFKTPATGSSLADSFSPATMFSSAIDTSASGGWTKVGSETKNSVSTEHYQATTAALAEYASSIAITDVTWSADVWIATDGGYPVSMDIVATASDKSIAYEIKFDITNVNDPANKVTAPTNVTGT